MARIGYVRVSTAGQNTARQEVQMPADLDKVFVDHASGKDTQRPQLKACLAYLRDGDVLIVESISRFARNTRDLLGMVADLTARGVEFVSLKETIDTRTPTGRFVLTLFAALAELEREQILQRQAEGIAIAKTEGKYRGRQPIKVDEAAFSRAYRSWRSGDITARAAMQRLDLTPNTFYRRVRDYEKANGGRREGQGAR